jgi:MFS family permease
VDAVTLGWITSTYIIAAAVFIVPFGRLADIRGRKRIFIPGVAIFTIASLACAFAPTENHLIAARFIQGIGGAMLFARSVAIVTQVYGLGERRGAPGITIAAVYAGLTTGPFIGGFLTDHFGWPAIFLINIPRGFVTILLTLLYISREWTDAEGEWFDLRGSVIYGVMLSCGIFGLLLLPDPSGIAWILVSIIAPAIFVWWQKQCSHPMLDLGIFGQTAPSPSRT